MIRTTVPDNPFEIRIEGQRPILYHQNAPALLAGIHVDTEPIGALTNEAIDGMMVYLKGKENNFYRHWVTPYWIYETLTGRKYSSPFLFTNEKWDLRFYNESYFSRLRYALSAARRQGVIVQITIFDFTGLKADGTAGGGPRWSWNPWNAKNNRNGVIHTTDGNGVTEFLDRSNTTLANLQDAYAKYVVYQTREFSNVIYEIINEPVGQTAATVGWSQAILNVISPLIQGRRLIFHNDHSGDSTVQSSRGKYVNHWKTQFPGTYASLDGVILHGDPNLVDPAQVDSYGWTWGHEKLIQLSTDAFPDKVSGTNREKRNDYNWNKNTTTTVLNRRESYQAESIDNEAAKGIRDATTSPTVLSLPPFVGCWNKISSAGPHFNLKFDSKKRFLAFNAVTDTPREAGEVTSFTDSTFTIRIDGQTNTTTFDYSLSDDGRTLTYASAAFIQTFTRIPFDLEPFLFGWQKVGESSVSNHPQLLLYFRKNGCNVSSCSRNPTDMAIVDQGDVVKIDPEANPPVMVINSQVAGPVTLAYEFFTDAQNIMHLKLTSSARWQDFKRIW